MNSTKVTVWLSHDAWTRYSIEARSRHVPLATHLRERLEQQDRIIADAVVRAATECSATPPAQSARAAPAGEQGILIEGLLLLRSIAGPQRSAVAQKEVERRGLPSWS